MKEKGEGGEVSGENIATRVMSEPSACHSYHDMIVLKSQGKKGYGRNPLVPLTFWYVRIVVEI